jgi:hypothetical protein
MVVGQIHTVDACNPLLPQKGEPLTCTDLQVSVHKAREPTRLHQATKPATPAGSSPGCLRHSRALPS